MISGQVWGNTGLDRVLSGIGGGSMIISVNLAIRWANSSKLKLWLVKEQQGRGRLVIFVVWKTLMFVCLPRHDYRVVLFLSWSITVTESYLTSMFCEIVYVQQENAKANPWGSGQLPDVRGCFSLCHTLSTRVLSSLLPSPQNSMVKFTLKSQFLHIWGVFVCFSLGVYM